jgi:hypothetical protein
MIAVDAGVGQTKALDRISLDEMLLNDLFRIAEMDAAVPDRVRIDDDNGTVFALVKTAGFVRAYLVLEACLLDGVLEGRLQFLAALRQAAGARGGGIALVGADKDVVFKQGHPVLDSVDRRRMHRPPHGNAVPAARLFETIASRCILII